MALEWEPDKITLEKETRRNKFSDNNLKEDFFMKKNTRFINGEVFTWKFKASTFFVCNFHPLSLMPYHLKSRLKLHQIYVVHNCKIISQAPEEFRLPLRLSMSVILLHLDCNMGTVKKWSVKLPTACKRQKWK